MRDVLNLFKLRIGVAIAVAALAGLAVERGAAPGGWQAAVLILAVLLSSAAAGAFNQYVERGLDARMARTRNRPFVTGALPHHPAWLWLIGAMIAAAVLAATLWGLASFALVLVLVGQAAYHYRSDLAAQVPELRGTLDRACEQLGCDVPLPTRAKLVTIESSEMQPDAGAPSVLALSAVLRNRAGFAQKQPWIELTLTDAQDRALARRVLAPRDYLGQRAEFEPTFAAGAEQSLRLLLDVEGLQARGYRLLVFYP